MKRTILGILAITLLMGISACQNEGKKDVSIDRTAVEKFQYETISKDSLPIFENGQTGQVSGIVYCDTDENNVMDKNEKPLAGVAVTDGEQVVQTDGQGRYSITVKSSTPIIYITVPAGYTAHNKFFATPSVKDGTATVDFSLKPDAASLDEKYTYALVADYQNDSGDGGVLLRNTMEQVLQDSEKPRFIVHLGDALASPEGLSYEMASRDYQNYRAAVAGAVEKDTILPIHTVIGNHDTTYDRENFGRTGEGYEYSLFHKYIGPTWYSWDYGNIHHIILASYSATNGDIIHKLSKKQLTWLENDLKLVSQDKPVILYAHVFPNEMKNEAVFLKVLQGRNVKMCFVGHSHQNYGARTNREAFWSISSASPTISIDDMPNGYRIVDINKDIITHTYKAFGQESQSLFLSYPASGTEVKGEVELRAHFYHALPGDIQDGTEYASQVKVKYQIDGGEWKDMEPYMDPVGNIFMQTWKAACDIPTGNHTITLRGETPGIDAVEYQSELTGKQENIEKWNFNGQEAGESVIYKPLLTEKGIIACTDKGNIYLLDSSAGSVKWKYTAPGKLTVAPAVFKNKLWALCDSKTVISVDLENGKGAGEYTYDSKGLDIYGLTCAADTVILTAGRWSDGKSTLTAYASKDGQIAWTKQVNIGYMAPPAQDSKNIYMQGGNLCISMDAKTGSVLWEYEADRSYLIGMVALGKDTVYATDYSAKVFLLDKKTGKCKNTFYRTESPRVTEIDDSMYMSLGPQGAALFSKKDIKEIWHFPRPLQRLFPVLYKDRVIVYGTDRTVYILNKKNGQILRSIYIGAASGGEGDAAIIKDKYMFLTVSGKGIVSIRLDE